MIRFGSSHAKTVREHTPVRLLACGTGFLKLFEHSSPVEKIFHRLDKCSESNEDICFSWRSIISLLLPIGSICAASLSRANRVGVMVCWCFMELSALLLGRWRYTFFEPGFSFVSTLQMKYAGFDPVGDRNASTGASGQHLKRSHDPHQPCCENLSQMDAVDLPAVRRFVDPGLNFFGCRGRYFRQMGIPTLKSLRATTEHCLLDWCVGNPLDLTVFWNSDDLALDI